MVPPEPAEGGDILIRGGSAEIHFNNEHFPKDDGDPKKRRFAGGKITRIEVLGAGDKDFNKDFPEGFKGTIKVSYK